MNAGLAADIAHQIGFLTGTVLYALLLLMVLRSLGSAGSSAGGMDRSWHERVRLPLYIAILGMIWNLASLASRLVGEITTVIEPAILSVVAISALGGLPALAMHSVWQTTAGDIRRRIGILVLAGYGLSVAASAWNSVALISGDPVPGAGAWRMLTVGFLILLFALLIAMKRALTGHRGLVVVLLTVCSVAALPLSHHSSGSLPWWLDFVGHHASLPVAVAVLYRDYRFTFVDCFIKRAIPFLLLVGMSVGLYVVAVLPLIETGERGVVSPAVSGLVIILWVATAIAYPWLCRQVARVLDVVLLRRPDYQEFRRQLAQQMDKRDTQDEVLGELCHSIRQVLRSTEVNWNQPADVPPVCLSEGRKLSDSMEEPGGKEVHGLRQTAESELSIIVPTLEAPRAVMTIAARVNDQRFLSEELLLVDAAALIAARRIDALRTAHERCGIALREQEMQRLTTEAELRALRAQVNPHFLFNALNTIGYLIDTAPERAVDTLKDLTRLMRGILRRMEGNFTTLGEEIDLIRSYLDIEQARFEERLSVRIEVPHELTRLQVPALVLQPLVENAVKHGIQPAVGGGAIRIAARQVPDIPRHGRAEATAGLLCIEIRDTGAGATAEALRSGRRDGIGLANVENRLRCHYGARASLSVVSEPGAGTTVEVRFPAAALARPFTTLVSTASKGRS